MKILPSVVMYIFRQLAKNIFRVFYIFPVQRNKIVFFSYGGKQYSCSSKYIYEYLMSGNDKDFDCIWCFNSASGREHIRHFLKSNIVLYFYHNLTAGFIVTNDILSGIIPYRKKQVVIYASHGGGAYKKCGLDLALPFIERANYKMASKTITWSLSAGHETSKAISSSYGIPLARILETGMPRSDLFFQSRPGIVEKVRSFYSLTEDAGIVLYAPTYRDTEDDMRKAALPDAEKILSAFDARFPEKRHVLLVRAHHKMSGKINGNFLDGNSYDDVQELIYASNAVITDYSSIVWDCCVAKKMLFLYTPDRIRYETERGLYYPVSVWGFPWAETPEELTAIIAGFSPEGYETARKKHLEMMGSRETGNATKKCVDLLKSLYAGGAEMERVKFL